MNFFKKNLWILYENNQFNLASALHFFRWSINIIKKIKYFNSKNPNQLSKLFNKYCYSQRFSCWKYCFFFWFVVLFVITKCVLIPNVWLSPIFILENFEFKSHHSPSLNRVIWEKKSVFLVSFYKNNKTYKCVLHKYRRG